MFDRLYLTLLLSVLSFGNVGAKPHFTTQNLNGLLTSTNVDIQAAIAVDSSFVQLGRHVIAEFRWCKNLTNHKAIEQVLRNAAHAANATILSVTVHPFELFPEQLAAGQTEAGFTAVAVLSESHISIHTWYDVDIETGEKIEYASIDVYTCGTTCDPMKAIGVLQGFFEPQEMHTVTIDRGYSLPE